MEGYLPVKMKRKDLDDVYDDFSDFSLSSPARKIRRLDADLPPIIEEEEAGSPAVFGPPVEGSPIAIDELSSAVPENGERAIVLFNPMNNVPLLQSRSPFSVTVNSHLLSGFKNPVIWSNKSDVIKSLEDETEKQDHDSGQSNGCLAVVPWMPSQSQYPTISEVEAPQPEVSEMMDADDMEATTMEIENGDSHQMPRNEYGATNVSEGLNQWQQHCLIPQPPSCNLSTPITWLGRGV